MNKNNEFEELSNTLLTIYLKNKNFFSKSFPKLHKKILEFEKVGLENYFIDFENNHFELKDKKNTKIYNCDPFFDAKSRCKNLKEKPSFNLIKNQISEDLILYEDEINAQEFINEYLRKGLNDKKEFNKFIFLGTLLGVHINDLHKIIKSKIYLIIEDNIEIFRLSMFLTDYEDLSLNSKILFCIQEDSNSKKQILKKFLSLYNEYNAQISFELANEFSIENIDLITKTFIDNDPLNYPFSEYLISLKRTMTYFNKYKNSFLKLETFHKIINKPVLFLGAGPSLSQSIEWVYMNQDYFLVVCAAATLKKLEILDIVPDIILNADGQRELVKKQYDVNEKYYKNSIIIASIKSDEEVIKTINHNNQFFMADNLEVFSETGTFAGVTVGDIGLQVLLKLGVEELYMLGFDAAVSQSGKTHIGSHYTNKVKNKKTNILKNSGLNTKKDLIEVKGNFRETVLTFLLYTQMIECINETTSKLQKNTKIYNLSDGAYFNNIVPLKKEDIKMERLEFLEKNIEKENLSKKLKAIVIEKLNSKDISYIKKEQKILKKLNNLNEKNYKIMFEKQKKQYENSLSIQILEKFFRLTNSYTKKLENNENIQFKQFEKVINNLKFSNSLD